MCSLLSISSLLYLKARSKGASGLEMKFLNLRQEKEDENPQPYALDQKV